MSLHAYLIFATLLFGVGLYACALGLRYVLEIHT